jgi:hypothetical protein
MKPVVSAVSAMNAKMQVAATSPSSMALATALQGSLLLLTGVLLIPYVQSLLSKKLTSENAHPWLYRAAWVSAFAVNLVTVSIPGRFDGQATRDSAANASKKGTILTFKPYFAPSGWAFAIWGIIYVGEMILTALVAAFGGKPLIVNALKTATPFWVSANLFQSLWCAAFRPKFKKMLWLPTLCLVGAAISQVRCLDTVMDVIVEGSGFSSENIGYFIAAFPIALHAGWLMAAALLNANSFVVENGATTAQNIALAFFSTYTAAGLATAVTYKTHNPFVMGVSAWALAAVADNTRNGKAQPTAKLESCTKDALAITEKKVSNTLLLLAPVVASSSILKKAINEAIF